MFGENQLIVHKSDLSNVNKCMPFTQWLYQERIAENAAIHQQIVLKAIINNKYFTELQ